MASTAHKHGAVARLEMIFIEIVKICTGQRMRCRVDKLVVRVGAMRFRAFAAAAGCGWVVGSDAR